MIGKYTSFLLAYLELSRHCQSTTIVTSMADEVSQAERHDASTIAKREKEVQVFDRSLKCWLQVFGALILWFNSWWKSIITVREVDKKASLLVSTGASSTHLVVFRLPMKTKFSRALPRCQSHRLTQHSSPYSYLSESLPLLRRRIFLGPAPLWQLHDRLQERDDEPCDWIL